jgi:hypothetical protein
MQTWYGLFDHWEETMIFLFQNGRKLNQNIESKWSRARIDSGVIPKKNANIKNVHNNFGILLFLAFLYEWHNLVEVSDVDEDHVSFEVNGLHN